MEPIRTLGEMTGRIIQQKIRKRIAVAMAEDPNTIGAIGRAASAGFAEPLLIGDELVIAKRMHEAGLQALSVEIIHEPDEQKASDIAVKMVKTGQADVLMKGLVNTDKFLKAVLNRETGLLPKGAVMSYVCAVQIPAYHKLLFITDTAVIPFPDLQQKAAMLNYAVDMAHRFGIDLPKVALISAVEKVSTGIPSTVDYSILCSMAARNQMKGCVVDGPLDVFLACDPQAGEIKGVSSPINGDADVLLFPSLEACNAFYKGLMLFAGGELAGLIRGTEKPVVMMSRSESENSKFYCIALSCLMAD